MKKSIYNVPLLAFMLVVVSCTSLISQNFKNINVDEAEKMIKENKSIVILDVRTPEEYKDGHLENALNIDIYNENFEKQIAALDKTKTYIVICRSGGRSASACRKMDGMGFKNLHNVEGGFISWSASGKKSVR